MNIPIKSIYPNPEQPRTDFDPAALQELADSIKEHGLLNPISVEDLGNGLYQLIDGERRWRAHKLAGLETIEAHVRPGMNGTGERDRLILALIGNLKRRDLNVVEQGHAFLKMREMGMPISEISRQMGLASSNIYTRMRLTELESEIQELYIAHKIPLHSSTIEAIASLPNDKRVRIARRLAQQKASFKVVLNVCKRITAAGQNHPQSPASQTATAEHYSALHLVPVSDEKLRNLVTKTCKACVLYEDATPRVCKDCPMVDLLRRM